MTSINLQCCDIKISSIQKKSPMYHMNLSRWLYTHSRQNINGCELVLEEIHYHTDLILQHCKFMLVNIMYSKILIF
jgi:hypothetical protein